VKAEIKSSLQNNIRTELREIEDQKQRALNLIIFNVPESKSENSLERKKFDNDITCPSKVLGCVFFKGLSECQRNVCAF
jgi:hypothetical protein